jgi:hypothetical protein
MNGFVIVIDNDIISMTNLNHYDLHWEEKWPHGVETAVDWRARKLKKH